ncbi:membrane protein [Aliivibrio wodanis]|uniref:Membrane protein n=1 Tax=Aliivibrio wodanis TaxID=80852 RepID=A0A090KHK2_9GAMM|nr:membrane protein [Aliivibrio wodanis]
MFFCTFSCRLFGNWSASRIGASLSAIRTKSQVAWIPILPCISIMTHQLCNPQREVTSYSKVWLKVAYISLAIGLLTLVSISYLGYQVTKSGYVKCINESRTFSKNSWRFYEKDLSLCKSLSGIAGG